MRIMVSRRSLSQGRTAGLLSSSCAGVGAWAERWAGGGRELSRLIADRRGAAARSHRPGLRELHRPLCADATRRALGEA
jgi:hypothetical protein